MFIIFFLVHIFFAGVFFLLEARIEGVLFCILWLISFFFFGPFRSIGSKKDTPTTDILSPQDTVSHIAKKQTLQFFQSRILPVSILLFYGALFGLFTQLLDQTYTILHTFLAIWCVVALLRTWIFYTQIEVTRILREVWDIHQKLFISFCFILLIWSAFQNTEISSLLLVFTSFLLLLSSVVEGRNILKPPSHISTTQMYILGHLILLEAGVMIFLKWPLMFSGIAILYAIALFEFWRSPPFHTKTLRALSVITIYITSLILIVSLYQDNKSMLVLVFLGISFLFNLYIHTRFENYPSLLLALTIPVVVLLSYIYLPENFLMFLGLMGIFSYGLTGIGRIFRTKHTYDEYIVQTLAILLAVSLTSWYAWKFSITSILQISALLLFFSGLFFVSYLQIRK